MKTNTVQHPLTGSSLVNLFRLLLKSGGIDKQYVPKLLYILLISALGLPLRLLENVRFGKQIQNTEIQLPPIFILGHWRSGTTHLHRLMAQDQNLGYVSSLQAFLPEIFLGMQCGWNLDLKKIWPEVRVMDNVTYAPDVPEEEEYALGNVLPLSFYHCWYFPKRMQEFFNQAVLLNDISDALREEWKSAYIKILKKTTFEHRGKRLVVKNPANTARVEILLELFPDAKFIHIYRDPYDVYASTKYFYEKLLPHYMFQKISKQELEENIFNFYQQLMQKFFDSVDAIPSNNLIEISYEYFDTHEIEVLKQVYEQLEIPEFSASESAFRQYRDAHNNYKKNSYVLDERTKEKINQRWEFAINRFRLLEMQH